MNKMEKISQDTIMKTLYYKSSWKKETKGLPPLPHLTIPGLAKKPSVYHKTLCHYVLEMLQLGFSCDFSIPWLTNRQKTEYELSVSKDNGCYLCGTVAANSTGL